MFVCIHTDVYNSRHVKPRVNVVCLPLSLPTSLGETRSFISYGVYKVASLGGQQFPKIYLSSSPRNPVLG